MEKINFIDPDTNEVVEFAVEEETQLNGIKYLLVSDGIEINFILNNPKHRRFCKLCTCCSPNTL